MLGEGHEIGGIRLERLLGRGAMGEVYRGVQLSLKRPVAVKRIADHLVDEPEAILRFEREAQVVARLQSQHVVQVFDFVRAQDADGKSHCLIVMELIEGGASLRDALKAAGSFSWQQAASLALQSAEGLAAAAEFGVIHRDVKPDNIMLTRKGVAKLADFGLARAMDSSAMTQEGALLGTPNYIAPEGCRGEAVDHRADLYSLGATWYHLATGQPPFTGDNLMALLRHHLETPAPDVRELAPDTPEPIAALIAACLAKVPDARPASAQVLAERLQLLAAEGLTVPRSVPELVPAAAGAQGEGSTANTALAGAETMPSGEAATRMAETAATALDSNQATAATRVAGGDDATLTAVGDGAATAATAATAVAEADPMLTAAASAPPAVEAAAPPTAPAVGSPGDQDHGAGRPGWRSLLLVTALVLGAGAGAAVLLTSQGDSGLEPGTDATTPDTSQQPEATPDAPASDPVEAAPDKEEQAQPQQVDDETPAPVAQPILVDAPDETAREPATQAVDAAAREPATASAEPGDADATLAAAAPTTPVRPQPATVESAPGGAEEPAPAPAMATNAATTAPAATPADGAAAGAIASVPEPAAEPVVADAPPEASAGPAVADAPPESPAGPAIADTPPDTPPESPAEPRIADAPPEPAIADAPPDAPPESPAEPVVADATPAVPTEPVVADPTPGPEVQQRPAEDPDIGTLTSIHHAIQAGQLAEAELWLAELSPDHPERSMLERAVADLQLRGAGLAAATESALAQEQWGRAERLLALVRENEPKLLMSSPAMRRAKVTIARAATLQQRELDVVRDAILAEDWLAARSALQAVPGDLEAASSDIRTRRGEVEALLMLEAGKAVDALLPKIDEALAAGRTATARGLLEQAQTPALVAGRFDEIKARRLKL